MLLVFIFHCGTVRNHPCMINVHCTWTLTSSSFFVSLIFRKSRTRPWYFRSGHVGGFRRRRQPIYLCGLQDWLLKQHLHHHGKLKSSSGCVQTDTDTKNEKKKRKKKCNLLICLTEATAVAELGSRSRKTANSAEPGTWNFCQYFAVLINLQTKECYSQTGPCSCIPPQTGCVLTS